MRATCSRAESLLGVIIIPRFVAICLLWLVLSYRDRRWFPKTGRPQYRPQNATVLMRETLPLYPYFFASPYIVVMQGYIGICIKDFKFVPFMFVTLGFGSHLPFFRAIVHGSSLRAQNPRIQTLRVQRKTP